MTAKGSLCDTPEALALALHLLRPLLLLQAQALLARVHVDATIMIDVNDKSLLLRAAERRVDTLTGKTYHLTHEPPPPDIPLTRLARRDLDDPASFKVRLDTHRTQLRRVAPRGGQ